MSSTRSGKETATVSLERLPRLQLTDSPGPNTRKKDEHAPDYEACPSFRGLISVLILPSLFCTIKNHVLTLLFMPFTIVSESMNDLFPLRCSTNCVSHSLNFTTVPGRWLFSFVLRIHRKGFVSRSCHQDVQNICEVFRGNCELGYGKKGVRNSCRKSKSPFLVWLSRSACLLYTLHGNQPASIKFNQAS